MKETTEPKASFQLLDPRYASPATIISIIGHGVAIKSFSNQTKKKYKGSKNASIASPFDLDHSLKDPSIPFFKSLRSRLPKLGNSASQSMKCPYQKLIKKAASVTRGDLNKTIFLERCLNLLCNICRHPRCPNIFIFD